MKAEHPTAGGIRTSWHIDAVNAAIGSLLIAFAYLSFELLQHPGWLGPVLAVMVAHFAFTIAVACAHSPYVTSPKGNTLTVAVVVAVRGDDPLAFLAMLRSLDEQSRLPHAIYVIENGASDSGTRAVFRKWAAQSPIERKVFLRRGRFNKREAQAVAFDMADETIVMTVDGYSSFEPTAITEGIKPFGNPQVMSVAGLLIGRNYDKTWLTRILDISFVSSLMVERAAWSRFGAVGANRGGLAFYRTWVAKRHLHDYVMHTIAGRPITSGDDRMLTGFAALEGKTVFQETAIGYTLLPETWRHASNRHARWWRSLWIGSSWTIRRFSPKRAIWWLTLLQMITFTLQAVAIPLLLVIEPIVSSRPPWTIIAYLVATGYIRAMRTLSIKRPSQTLTRQFASVLLLAPAVAALELWLNVALLWYGVCTQHQTQWQQHKVKVAAHE